MRPTRTHATVAAVALAAGLLLAVTVGGGPAVAHELDRPAAEAVCDTQTGLVTVTVTVTSQQGDSEFNGLAQVDLVDAEVFIPAGGGTAKVALEGVPADVDHGWVVGRFATGERAREQFWFDQTDCQPPSTPTSRTTATTRPPAPTTTTVEATTTTGGTPATTAAGTPGQGRRGLQPPAEGAVPFTG